MSSANDHQVLIQYLLGSLPEAETARLDELSIADDEFVSRLGAAENELVDAYVRGELSGDDLRRFSAHYLSSQRRRDKVAFADALRLREIREAAPAARAAAVKPARRSAAWRFLTISGPAPAWAFAGVAALTLVAAAYLLVANRRLQQESTHPQSDRASLEDRVRDLQTRRERTRSVDAGVPKEPDGGGRARAKVEPLRLASLLLDPPTRGLGRVERLAVPPATDTVSLNLQLETDEFPRYRVSLKAAANDRTVWRADKLESTLEGDRRVIAVLVPAALLTPGRYFVELTGETRRGAAELLGTYAFEVVR